MCSIICAALPISVMGWIHLHAREREEKKKKHQEEENLVQNRGKQAREGLLAIISSSSCAIDEEEESDSKHNYESDDDDDFNNSEWELEEWAIRNDGVLVRKTPMQWPSSSSSSSSSRGSGRVVWIGRLRQAALWPRDRLIPAPG
jgi:hypothetical protein